MEINDLIGDILILISRIGVIILASTFKLWMPLCFGIHFLLMMGCSLFQDKTKKLNGMQLLKIFITSIIKCLCNPFSKTEARWSKIIFYVLIIAENVSLISFYFMWSLHEQWMIISGTLVVCIFTFVGILLKEFKMLQHMNSSSLKDEEKGTTEGTVNGVEQEDCVIQETLEVPLRPKEELSKVETCNERNKNRDTMCSIQDLLANTSVMKNLYEDQDESVHLSPAADDSIHQVGLPLVLGGPTETAVAAHGSSFEGPTRTPSPTDTCSEVLRTSSHSSNYENIYDAVQPESVSPNSSGQSTVNGSHTLQCIESNLAPNFGSEQFLPQSVSSFPKPVPVPNPSFPPLSMPTSCNHSLALEISHDYENVFPINVYRENTGVRHWKPYLDIEDRIHDYSTFKERSEIQDSTMMTSIYSRPRAGAWSISLPDLSNIEAVTYGHVEANGDYQQPSDAIVPNYETIWYDHDHQDSTIAAFTVGDEDHKAKESLCNLYYSSLADLSSKYFYDEVKRSSLFAEPKEASAVRSNLLIAKKEENSQEAPTGDSVSATPAKRTGSLKRIQKSPIVKLMSRSHTSLQERTSKVLQVGRRVFYKPRVHVITPKKELQPQRRASCSSRTRIDPYIIRRRSDLSPKNHLILSEASSLINQRNKTLGAPQLQTPQNKPHAVISSSSMPRHDPEKSLSEGPQHSTPETDRHLPQISILSAISSVNSPEDTLRSRTQSSSSIAFAIPKSHKNLSKRCSAKQLEEMSVIKETSNTSIHL